MLETVNSPADLKKLSPDERRALASDIRRELLEVISKNGGHLAPNLGVVELSIALHSAFSSPDDKILWDVGHQGYVHKLLTGRKDFFKTLRTDEGCSGFLSKNESEHDSFGAGHAGTAISAALGFAAARDRKGMKHKVVAVVGDGSLNCGVALEGLNSVSETTRDFVIVLNDNKMSISKNVGAMSLYLNRMITGKGYNRFKLLVRNLVLSIPGFGKKLARRISRIEEAAKSVLVRGVIFEELGMRYIGPIDGHDMEELIRIFDVIKDFDQPVIVHAITEKGRGCKFAEDAPEKFHGTQAFDPDTGASSKAVSYSTFSSSFGVSACLLAEKRNDVVAITAAMSHGTGLAKFAEQFPDRFFDVGIAEEHAVVFAAGLASHGMRPIVAIYATFMQRSLDYILHDVCLQNLPVIFCLDRAGIVEDGPTHHGIHDLAFIRNLPNISVLQPKDGQELMDMLFAAYEHKSPVVIRYPRASSSPPDIARPPSRITWGAAEQIREGKDISIWSLGNELSTAREVASLLEKKSVSVSLVNCRFIKPFDSDLLIAQAGRMPLASIEDSVVSGGLGSIIDGILIDKRQGGVIHFGWDADTIIPHGSIEGIRRRMKMTPIEIAEKISCRFGFK